MTDALIIRRYTFKMRPNAAQEAALFEVRYLVCQLYNALIEQRRDAWGRRKKSVGKFEQMRECTLLRHDDERYKALGSTLMERCVQRVDQAYNKYFDDVKLWKLGLLVTKYGRPPSPPSFQKTSEFSGFGYKKHEVGGWKLIGNSVRLKCITGTILIAGQFPEQPESLQTCDVMFRDGKWWLSIVVKLKDEAAMRAATGRFSKTETSKLPFISESCIPIRSADHENEGNAQVHCSRFPVCIRSADHENEDNAQERHARLKGDDRSADHENAIIKLNLLSTFGTLTDATGTRQINVSQAKGKAGPRGAKNKAHRRVKAIRRQEYDFHVLTTALAQKYQNINIYRPPLKDATKSAKGTQFDHGAQVEWKADFNRDVLDWGAGKFCQMLTYKMEAAGKTVTVIELDDHTVMTANAIVDTAKIAKKARQVAKKMQKRGAMRAPTSGKSKVQTSNYPQKAMAYA